MRKVERVKCNYPRDAAAGADTRDLRMRIGSNVREIADEGGESDERKITKRAEKILDVITKDKKEIDIADEMENAGMKKK